MWCCDHFLHNCVVSSSGGKLCLPSINSRYLTPETLLSRIVTFCPFIKYQRSFVFLINVCPLSFSFTFKLHITINLNIIRHQKSNCGRKNYKYKMKWISEIKSLLRVILGLYTHSYTHAHTHTLIPRSFLFIKSLNYSAYCVCDTENLCIFPTDYMRVFR